MLLESHGGRWRRVGAALSVLWMGEILEAQPGSADPGRLCRKHIMLAQRDSRWDAVGVPVVIRILRFPAVWAFDDFVEIGISVVDTLQPEARIWPCLSRAALWRPACFPRVHLDGRDPGIRHRRGDVGDVATDAGGDDARQRLRAIPTTTSRTTRLPGTFGDARGG